MGFLAATAITDYFRHPKGDEEGYFIVYDTGIVKRGFAKNTLERQKITCTEEDTVLDRERTVKVNRTGLTAGGNGQETIAAVHRARFDTNDPDTVRNLAYIARHHRHTDAPLQFKIILEDATTKILERNGTSAMRIVG